MINIYHNTNILNLKLRTPCISAQSKEDIFTLTHRLKFVHYFPLSNTACKPNYRHLIALRLLLRSGFSARLENTTTIWRKLSERSFSRRALSSFDIIEGLLKHMEHRSNILSMGLWGAINGLPIVVGGSRGPNMANRNETNNETNNETIYCN